LIASSTGFGLRLDCLFYQGEVVPEEAATVSDIVGLEAFVADFHLLDPAVVVGLRYRRLGGRLLASAAVQGAHQRVSRLDEDLSLVLGHHPVRRIFRHNRLAVTRRRGFAREEIGVLPVGLVVLPLRNGNVLLL
jgi:hypothetical protein